MPRKSKVVGADEPVFAKRTTIEESLAKIAETASMGDRLRKKQGQVADSPEDIYEYTVKRADSDTISDWIMVHGKCVDKQLATLETSGYVALPTRHILKSDKHLSRTVCIECGEQLNAALAKELLKEQRERLATRKVAHAKKVEYKRQLDMEAVLLGKL